MKIKILVMFFVFFCAACNQKTQGSISPIDSLANQLNSLQIKIDSINKSQDSTISDLKSELEEYKLVKDSDNKNVARVGQNIWFILGGSLLGVIILALIIWNFVFNKNDGIESRLGELEDIIKKMEMKTRSHESTMQSYKRSDEFSLDYSNIIRRLDSLEEGLRNEFSREKRIVKQDAVRVSTVSVSKYFGINKYNLFTDVYSSPQDECVFSVNFNLDNTRGEFNITELKRIKSLDGIDMAIKISGNALLPNARSFKVIKKGQVVKEGDYWKIVSPLEIEISE